MIPRSGSTPALLHRRGFMSTQLIHLGPSGSRVHRRRWQLYPFKSRRNGRGRGSVLATIPKSLTPFRRERVRRGAQSRQPARLMKRSLFVSRMYRHRKGPRSRRCWRSDLSHTCRGQGRSPLLKPRRTETGPSTSTRRLSTMIGCSLSATAKASTSAQRVMQVSRCAPIRLLQHSDVPLSSADSDPRELKLKHFSRVHLEGRPFACPVPSCNWAFHDRTGRDRHVYSNHFEVPDKDRYAHKDDKTAGQ